MITNFKIFEELNENNPNINDYVLLVDNQDFFMKNIGKIKFIVKNDEQENVYIIEYKEDIIPEKPRVYFKSKIEMKQLLNTHNYDVELNKDCFYYLCLLDRIKYWSSNKEDLEIILDMNKYNI